IILGHELYRGSSGFSGELGHMKIQADHGLPCNCGSTGCWEMYASENALLHAAGRTGSEGDVEEVLRRASEGDGSAAALLADIGRYLGVGIANIMNALNPELIIVGNRLALAKPWMTEAIQASVERSALRFHRE